MPSGQLIPDDDPAYKEYCNPQYYCANSDKINIVADMSDSISLRNWMYYQDILCDSSFLVGLFGMLNFIGMCQATLWSPRLLDKFGRKRVLLYSEFVQILCKIVIVMLPNDREWTVNMYYILIFVNGSMQICRANGCYNLMCEVAPASTHTAMGTAWNMLEGLVFIILTLYFRFISKEWRWSIVIGIIYGIIGYSILLLVLPESPKWQYDRGHYRDCYKTL